MENDPSRYKWGLFYWNPKDPRIFVPKLTGLGWTVNFAKPQSWIVMAILLLAVFLIRKR